MLLSHPYLEGIRYTIKNNQASLRRILNLTDRTGRLARSWLELSEFGFGAADIAGVKHQVVDALSRLPTNGEGNTSLKDDIRLLKKESSQNIANTHFRVIGPNKDDTVSWNGDKIEVSIHTPPTESRLLTEKAQKTYCETETIEVSCQGSEFFLALIGNSQRIPNLQIHRWRSNAARRSRISTPTQTVLVSSSAKYRTSTPTQDG